MIRQRVQRVPHDHRRRAVTARSRQHWGRFLLAALAVAPAASCESTTAPSPAIKAGSVANGSLGSAGNPVEFTFQAATGEEYYAFLQAQSDLETTVLQLNVLDASGALLAWVQSAGTDTSLFGQITPLFEIRASGTYRLQVRDVGSNVGYHGDPYRMLLYRLNRKPESVPDTLVFGDSVLGESIDTAGDIDEYRVRVPSMSGANLALAFLGAGTLEAQLVDSATGQIVDSTLSTGNGAVGQGIRLAIGQGSHIVRVQAYAPDGRPHVRGPYRLWLFRFGTGPERTRDTIAIGDTVASEAIDVPGDVDTYHLYGAAGQHINVMLQGLAEPMPGEGFAITVLGPWGSWPPLAVVGSPSSAAALADHQTQRMDLPVTGWYTATVTARTSDTASLGFRGPYRFAVVPVGTAPESRGGSLAIGDSVTTEAIDYPGDWDQYTVRAAPGTPLYVLFGTGAPCCTYPDVAVWDSTTGDTLAGQVGQGMRVTEPFPVPASGVVSIAVREVPLSNYDRQCLYATCTYGYTGSYVLEALVLNRAPETAPAAYTLGDTVSTEAIERAGDIDEFNLTATPGDTLSAWIRLPADPLPAGSGISLDVVDAATGSVLNGNGYIYQSQPQYIEWAVVVVPPSGQLILRFRGTGTTGYDAGTGPYEFYVRRGQ